MPLLSSANNNGEIANTNIIVYAAIPHSDNGISIVPKCNDAYGPCNTSLHDDAPPLSEHNAPINDEDVFEDVYCILSYVRYAVSKMPMEEIATSCFRRFGFQHEVALFSII